MMSRRGSTASVLAIAALVIGLSACQRNEEAAGKGPAEKVGEQIDSAASKAAETVKDGAEKTGEAAKQAGEKVEGAVTPGTEKPPEEEKK